MSVSKDPVVFRNPFYNFCKSILLTLVVLVCQINVAKSQSCTGCTYTISSSSSTSYTLTSGQKLCVTSTGTYTGSVTLSGGTICSYGNFSPSSFTYSSGYFDNYGSATVTSISLSQAGTTLTNYSGATLTINTSYASSASGASFINNGTVTIGTSFAVSAGSFTNSGSTSVGTTTAVSGGTFTNSGSFTAHGISPSGGTFTNSSSGAITNTGDFANSAIGGSNAGTISNTGNFTNSGTFTNSSGSISSVNFSNNGGTITLSGGLISSTNFTNSGTINGPASGAGCGAISATTTTTNSGTINGYSDICDATPPSGSVKIDANSGTVAGTVTYCTCCVLNTPSITGTSTICNGASTTLTASSGTSYSWNTSATTQAITVSPTATTTYTVTITYANSCTRTVTQTVTVNPKPTAVAGSNTSYCTGGSASIGGTATGGTTPYTYAWSPSTGLSSTTVSSPTANPTSTTTYTVTVTGGNGCTSTSAVTVTVNAKPTASAGSNVNINSGGSTAIGGNPTATGGTSPYTYSWSPSNGLSSTTVANPMANPDTSTTYKVVVTSSNGCTASSSVVVILPLQINYNVTDVTTASPNSGSITVIPANGLRPYTYVWSTGSTQSSITGLAKGKYIVTVTDAAQTAKTTIIYVGKQITWVNPSAGGIAIQPDNQSLKKTDSQNIWGTGTVASSNNLNLNAVDSNWVEFKVSQNNVNYVVGIATNINDSAALSANYKIYIENNVVFSVEIDQDGNFIKQQIGTSNVGDVLRIELSGSSINYLLNGQVLRSIDNFPLTKFYIESDIYNTNAIVGNIRASF